MSSEQTVCLTVNGEISGECVGVEYVWRHSYSLPIWCRRVFSYSVDESIKLSIPVYIEGFLRKLCIEVYEDKVDTYSHPKLSSIIDTVLNDLKQAEKKSVSDVLEYLFKNMLNHYYEYLTKLDNEVESLINKILKGVIVYEPIYNLYSHASKLHRGVHGLIYGLERLESRFKALTDLASEAIMLENMYSTSIDRITQAFNLYYTLIGEKTNRVVTKLTIISAIFLPLTLIAGIYGMNFEYMPELHHPLAYPITLTVMALIALAELIYFKKKKWI